MDVAIRPIRLEDAEDINEIRRMPGVMENILGYPSIRVEKEEEFIRSLEHGTGHEFVAVINRNGKEKVIGTAGLHVSTAPRCRHSAGIGIMVHTKYQGQGIGRRLLDALLDLADNWLMLIRVELTVFSDNERAVRMYERAGFTAEGTQRCGAVRNGKYEDLLMMARIRLPECSQ